MENQFSKNRSFHFLLKGLKPSQQGDWKGIERREEKRREEKRTDQLIFLKLPFRANYFLLNIPYFPDS